MKPILTIAVALIATFSYAQTENFHLDEVYPIDKDGTIRLLSDDAEVTIIGENRNDVSVFIDRTVRKGGIHTGDAEFRVEVSIIDGDLKITEFSRSNGFSMGYTSEEYEIRIKAPKSVALDIKGDDDDYNIKYIDGNIDLDTDDSDIKVADCKTPELNLKIDDGDVEIIGLNGDLKARMDDGDLKLINSNLQNIDFIGDDSYVYIETILATTGNYNLSGDDAEFEFDVLGGGGQFTISHDDGHVRASSDFEITYESDSKTELKLPGGNCLVKFKGDDIDVRLNAQLAN